MLYWAAIHDKKIKLKSMRLVGEAFKQKAKTGFSKKCRFVKSLK